MQARFRLKGNSSIKAQARANISQHRQRTSRRTPRWLVRSSFRIYAVSVTRPLEQLMMQPAKFCSECGEGLKAARARLIRGRATCDRCAPRFRARRFLKVISLALLIIVAFAIGRYGTPPRTVYLIGTPIEPIATAEPGATSAANASSTSHETRTTNAADDLVAICGAPTKSGRPCQRKVKGGGYCYQHRDKYGQKKQESSSR